MPSEPRAPGFPDLSEIRRRRVLVGLSQGALARSAGVSQSLVAKIERGKVEPSYRIVQALFQSLGRHEHRAKPEVSVGHLMSSNLVTVAPGALVSEAAHLLRRHSISQVPVLDHGFSVGSLTDRLVVSCLADPSLVGKLASVRVRQVMGDPFPQIDETATRSIAVALLGHVPAILVTREGRLTGIVTQSDLFKEL
jgi:predicted transcriptional regulator